MRRLVWIAAGIAVCALALIALAPRLVSSEAVKTRLAEQISGWTGRAVALSGDPVVSLFPSLTVTLNDVAVAGPDDMPDADIISMETLRASVRVLPLLIGEVEVESFVLERPEIRLVRDAGGRENWLFDSGVAAMQLAFAGDVPLGTFTIEDGTLFYEDRERGTTERVEDIDLTLAWNSVRAPLAAEGSAVWRGERVAVQASATDPFAFLKGESSAAQATLSAAPVEARFTGEAFDFEAPRLEGALDVATPSVARLAGWLGIGSGREGTIVPARLQGTANVTGDEMWMRDASLVLDENRATGLLRVVYGGIPVVSGTLASPSLDLASYAPSLARVLEGRSGDWRTARVEADWLKTVEADLRLSAERIALGRLALDDVAASVLVKSGALHVGLGEATLHGGSLSGSLSVAQEGPDVTAEAQLRAEGVRAQDAAAALGVATDLSGETNVVADLTTRGATLGDLVANLDGTVTVDAMSGTLPGLGLDAVAAALRSGAAPASVEPGGTTAFEALDASIAFADRAAILHQAALETGSYAATASGRIGLDTGALALRGALALDGEGAQQAPFTIDGTLARPDVRLGPQPPG